jgi:hypothetical protein
VECIKKRHLTQFARESWARKVWHARFSSDQYEMSYEKIIFFWNAVYSTAIYYGFWFTEFLINFSATKLRFKSNLLCIEKIETSTMLLFTYNRYHGVKTISPNHTFVPIPALLVKNTLRLLIRAGIDTTVW